MPRRILIVLAVTLACLVVNATKASASDTLPGFGPGRTHTGASAGRHRVTVTAGATYHRNPTRPSPSQPTSTTDPPSSDPAPTYTCVSGPINLVGIQELLGVGGPEPGYWAITECTGPGAPPPSRPFWVTVEPDPTPPAGASAAPPAPATVAAQAVKTLHLASPVIEMAPPENAEQILGVPVWLWVSPAAWQPEQVSATVDGVTASATATPEEVMWNTGDGHTLTCDGPGTPYDPSEPDATTDCSYTWTTPSSTQPSGTYQVTATIEFAVAWTAAGAAGGGGNLGVVPGTTATAQVTVGEAEALNTPTPKGTNLTNTGSA